MALFHVPRPLRARGLWSLYVRPPPLTLTARGRCAVVSSPLRASLTARRGPLLTSSSLVVARTAAPAGATRPRASAPVVADRARIERFMVGTLVHRAPTGQLPEPLASE